jgi:hypothetical protein
MNRKPPGLGPAAMKTYAVSSPITTHHRDATCAEVECVNHERGWVTVIDETTDLGAKQARYIRQVCRPVGAQVVVKVRARYTEARTAAGWTEFTFGPGQECFIPHKVPLGRPEIYVVRDGDSRGNPRGTLPRRHDRAEHWVEDMAGHLDGLKTLTERG